MTNYTVGSSIFCKLHLGVFDFLTFILQGPQFGKKYTLGLSKIGIFSYTLGLGVRPNILTPRHFLLEVPPGVCHDCPHDHSYFSATEKVNLLHLVDSPTLDKDGCLL